jgi:steroid 5-alpha reductase family enzyme
MKRTTAGRFCETRYPNGSSKSSTLPSSVRQRGTRAGGGANSLPAIIQNILLFMLGLPAYQVLRISTIPLGLSDLILGVLCVTTLATEFTADNQQWSYQNFKHGGGKINPNEWPGANIQWTEADRKRGFVSRGLWAWSRHPNFACEQTFWVSNYLLLMNPPTPHTQLPTTLARSFRTFTCYWPIGT